jgi:UDP-N-acetyl-D-mannosaminuronic acid dehydrogenase
MKFNEVLLIEPNINQIPKGFYTNSTKLTSIEDALKVVDIVVLLVDHIQFKSMDLSLLSDKQIIDTRGIWQ